MTAKPAPKLQQHPDDVVDLGNIHTAMQSAMASVGYVHKAGQMAGGGLRYRYAGEADFIAAIRPALVDAGIYGPLPVNVCHSITEHGKTSRGAMQYRVDVMVTYRLTHGPSGSFVEMIAPGCGIDTGDKATAKAMTGALKYALRQSFCIETGDDPDKYPSTEQETAAAQPAVDPAEAAHDDEWAADRKRFCSRLTHEGVKYGDVREFCLSRGFGKPSTWGREDRGRFIADLMRGQFPALTAAAVRAAAGDS